jgi:CDP-paratose 2-epimerase
MTAAGGHALIVGGAGFIGTNIARRLLDAGQEVAILDSLARAGSEGNLRWLQRTYGARVEFHASDVREPVALRRALARATSVFHLAGQVAVTTSLVDPMLDFDVNLRGTLTLLEELRRLSRPVPLIHASTRKVYGSLDRLPLRELATRYEPADPEAALHGVDERWPLELDSPHGCSKGAADQYVLEYGRCFGLPTLVARLSCIYGPHQLGNEDQGWVTHFLLRAIQGWPLTICGDGKQVRDILYIDDLVDAFLLLMDGIDRVGGRVFNIGGGPASGISLIELLGAIAELRGSRPHLQFTSWRASDQRYYVSDTRRLEDATGWRPQVAPADGIRRLHDWLVERALADLPATAHDARPLQLAGEVA